MCFLFCLLVCFPDYCLLPVFLCSKTALMNQHLVLLQGYSIFTVQSLWKPIFFLLVCMYLTYASVNSCVCVLCLWRIIHPCVLRANDYWSGHVKYGEGTLWWQLDWCCSTLIFSEEKQRDDGGDTHWCEWPWKKNHSTWYSIFFTLIGMPHECWWSAQAELQKVFLMQFN